MKRLTLSVLVMLSFLVVRAQQVHFIYIQTENRQPFYIKLDKKIFSSSASGYVVIPKLSEGSYALTIGFPKNEWTEQNVTCKVDKKDLGFVLKNLGEKGWALFNLQTLELIMASKVNQPAAKVEIIPAASDEFSNVLATVVNDPTLRQPVQEDTEPVTATPAIAVTSPVQQAFVRTLMKKSAGNSAQMLYLVGDAGFADTVDVLIAEEAVIDLPVKPVEQADKIVADPATVIPKTAEKKEDARFIDMKLENPNGNPSGEKTDAVISTKKLTTDSPLTASKKLMIPNSDCKKIANDDDFLKLRKKMAGLTNDDDMVNAAKKAFKAKCYSTDQVKNLSVLFLKDIGKYQLFDAAYPYVVDTYSFSTLQTQLTDEYFINRFKAMITH